MTSDALGVPIVVELLEVVDREELREDKTIGGIVEL